MLHSWIANTCGKLAPGSLLPQCAEPECRIGGRSIQALLSRKDWVRFEGETFCSSECLTLGLHRRLPALVVSQHRGSRVQPHRIPLGLALLSKNLITSEQLNAAVQIQKKTPSTLIGQILRLTTGITEHAIAATVATQWGCALYPEDKISHCSTLLPKSLIQSYQAMPVHWLPNLRQLYIGFTQQLDYSLLFAAEKILHCRAIPAIVVESALSHLHSANACAENEVQFIGSESINDVIRCIGSYCEQVGARELRLAAFNGNLWARLCSERQELDLIYFRKEV